MRKFLIMFFVLAVCFSAAAGDKANFVNLGFSTNSRYYMFAQYGLDTDTYYPYAEILVSCNTTSFSVELFRMA